MKIGMEQVVWAVIFVIFIIITVLKSRARRKTLTTTEKPMEVKKKVEERQDRLGRYLENILGIERPEPEPQRITIEEEKPGPLKERVTPKTKLEEGPGKFESPLMKELREREKAVIPEKKKFYHVKFPWGTISREDLPSAIIFAEIIGPPISKRKSHRLF
jgi:hypothetical protein